MNAQTTPYPIPTNDVSRSQFVEALKLQDRRSDPFFAHVTDLTKQIFNTPIAYLSLMGADTQTLLHCNGADVDSAPRNISLCAFTVAAKKTIILPDTHLDPRSAEHPMVTGHFQLRFSASAPVVLSSGFCIGTLCAVDMVPHEPPTEDQITALEAMAAMTARFYEAPGEPDHERAAELRRIVDDAQEEFLSLVGHEMRTPLNGIFGLSQVLETADAENQEILDAISGSATLLVDIVESILSFTELKSGDITLDEAGVDFSRLLHKSFDVLGPTMRMRKKTCDLSGIADGLQLSADGPKLELAIACVATNFIAHGGNNGWISANADADGTILIELRDDGEGFSEDREARIWEAFGTGKAVHNRTADGLGLGLPLTRRIVELHGGTLDLIRTNPGVKVQIRMPAWRNAAYREAVPVSAA